MAVAAINASPRVMSIALVQLLFLVACEDTSDGKKLTTNLNIK
jgi:hypothetical protein